MNRFLYGLDSGQTHTEQVPVGLEGAVPQLLDEHTKSGSLDPSGPLPFGPQLPVSSGKTLPRAQGPGEPGVGLIPGLLGGMGGG